MINFTVGPVQTYEYIREIGAEQVPYFRTKEFSQLMFENEKMFLELVDADTDSKAVFLTGSGTAAMESAVMNLLSKEDKVLVIDGGSFGHRFHELCEIHNVNHDVIILEAGHPLEKSMLMEYSGKGYTALLINMHETSTGVLYDMNMVGEFGRNQNMFLIVDAISAFLAEEISMKSMNIGALIISSQKALACPPGISAIALSNEGIERAMNNDSKCMYLNIKSALVNGDRGQTPFTPAVSILIQIHARLQHIIEAGGVQVEIERVKKLANHFRKGIEALPLEVFTKSPSNAVTAVSVGDGVSTNDIFNTLKNEYGIWICPNGGDLGKKIFRVGHIGALTIEDNERLLSALDEIYKRGLLTR